MSDRRAVAWYQEDPLTAELVKLREIGVEGLYRTGIELPTLFEAARLIAPNAPPERRATALNAVLDSLFSDHESPMRGQHQRRAASELFGHADTTYGMPEPDRRARVADDYYHQALETFRRDDRGGREPALIREVAEAIKELCRLFDGTNSLKSIGWSEEQSYVHRTELEAKLEALLSSENKIVYVLGDAGTGKTTLARTIGKSRCGDPLQFLEIDATSLRTAIGDMRRYLERRGRTCSALSDHAVETGFWQLMADPRSDGLRVLLLDGMEEYRLPWWVTPSALWPQTVVAGRRHPKGAGPNNSLIVGNMSLEEACEMVLSRLPNVSDREAELLAKSLDGRALAIEHSCAYLVRGDMEIAAFCAAIDAKTSAMLEQLGPNDHPTLTAIYRHFLEEIKGSPAETLLGVLALAPSGAVDAEVAQEITRFALNGPDTLPIDHGNAEIQVTLSRVSAFRGVRTLHNLSLVQLDGAECLQVHALTRAILHGLLEDKVDALRLLIVLALPQTSRFDGRMEALGRPDQEIWMNILMEALDLVRSRAEYPTYGQAQILMAATLAIRNVRRSASQIDAHGLSEWALGLFERTAEHWSPYSIKARSAFLRVYGELKAVELHRSAFL